MKDKHILSASLLLAIAFLTGTNVAAMGADCTSASGWGKPSKGVNGPIYACGNLLCENDGSSTPLNLIFFSTTDRQNHASCVAQNIQPINTTTPANCASTFSALKNGFRTGNCQEQEQSVWKKDTDINGYVCPDANGFWCSLGDSGNIIFSGNGNTLLCGRPNKDIKNPQQSCANAAKEIDVGLNS